MEAYHTELKKKKEARPTKEMIEAHQAQHDDLLLKLKEKELKEAEDRKKDWKEMEEKLRIKRQKPQRKKLKESESHTSFHEIDNDDNNDNSMDNIQNENIHNNDAMMLVTPTKSTYQQNSNENIFIGESVSKMNKIKPLPRKGKLTPQLNGFPAKATPSESKQNYSSPNHPLKPMSNKKVDTPLSSNIASVEKKLNNLKTSNDIYQNQDLNNKMNNNKPKKKSILAKVNKKELKNNKITKDDNISEDNFTDELEQFSKALDVKLSNRNSNNNNNKQQQQQPLIAHSPVGSPKVSPRQSLLSVKNTSNQSLISKNGLLLQPQKHIKLKNKENPPPRKSSIASSLSSNEYEDESEEDSKEEGYGESDNKKDYHYDDEQEEDEVEKDEGNDHYHDEQNRKNDNKNKGKKSNKFPDHPNNKKKNNDVSSASSSSISSARSQWKTELVAADSPKSLPAGEVLITASPSAVDGAVESDWVASMIETDEDEAKLAEVYETGFAMLMMENGML